MFKRKQYLIDKGIQLRTTFTAIGFTFLCVALFIVLMGTYINQTNEKIRNVITTEDQIFQVLTTVSGETDSEQTAMNRSMAKQHFDNQNEINSMIDNNMRLIWIIIASVFLSGVIFFFILVRQTHKIAGPVYVMTRYMKEIADGKIPQHFRPLRKSDQLKEFYEVFKDMAVSIGDSKKAGTVKSVKKTVKASKKQSKAVKKKK